MAAGTAARAVLEIGAHGVLGGALVRAFERVDLAIGQREECADDIGIGLGAEGLLGQRLGVGQDRARHRSFTSRSSIACWRSACEGRL